MTWVDLRKNGYYFLDRSYRLSDFFIIHAAIFLSCFYVCEQAHLRARSFGNIPE